MKLVIELNILDETRLRTVAADRMANSGFEPDPKEHINKSVGDLVFEALIGSNPDTLSPDDMGLEIVSWTSLENA